MFFAHTHTISGIIMVLAVLFAIFLVPAVRKFAIKHILALVLVTYAAGFALYLWGFWFGASSNIFSATLRAAISALEMFASHSDLVEVNEHLKEDNIFYMMAFSLVHFMAFTLMIIFVLDMFGKRLVSRCYSFLMILACKKKKLFVFDSTDDNSVLIARSLDPSPENLILFINSNNEDRLKHFSIYDLLIRGLNSQQECEECEKLGYVLWAPTTLSDAVKLKRGWLYRRILKMLEKCICAEIFFTEWDSHTNADAAFELEKVTPKWVNLRIYAGVNVSKPHTRKLFENSRIIIYNRSKHVVDDLCARTPLLREGSGRRTLILGFGYTARCCIMELVKAGFQKIDVIDPEVGKRGEQFLCLNPELRRMKGIKLLNHDLKSNDYWSYLNENLDDIDNVIIFGQDKETNFETASQVAEFATKGKKDLQEFRIYLMEDEAQPGDDSAMFHTFGKNSDICNYAQISGQTE